MNGMKKDGSIGEKISNIREALGNTKLGFGTYRLPLQDGIYGTIDQDKVNRMIGIFLDRGYRYIETAYGYHGGRCQEIVSNALKNYNRKDYLLAGKCPLDIICTSEDYDRVFSEQLMKSQVEYFDFYLLHNIRSESYQKTENLGGFSFLNGLKERGYVKYVGFSFHDNAELLDEILKKKHDSIDFVQLQINYLDWESPVIQAKKCYETAYGYGLPVFVMEPAKGGELALLSTEARDVFLKENPESSAISWAYRFAASLENVVLVLSGMSDMKQVYENTALFSDLKPLRQNEALMIQRVAEMLKGKKRIQCTNCGYCRDVCPKNIPIPEFLHLLENDNTNKEGRYYQSACRNKGHAADCIKCGGCERICSQHIEIRKYLREASDKYDPAIIKKIRAYFHSLDDPTRRIYVFGAGEHGKHLYRLLRDYKIDVYAFIDNDIQKQRQRIEDICCISLDKALAEGGKESIIIVSPLDNVQILEQLNKNGAVNVVDMHSPTDRVK